MLRKLVHTILPASASFLALLTASHAIGPAKNYSTLYSFCSKANCADGQYSYGGVIADAQGNLYGATIFGGANNGGAVYKITPGGKEKVLYSFCSATHCADGAYPDYGNLVFDAAGNLYGTTEHGGSTNNGAVFKLSPAGVETVLHSFGSVQDDGAIPQFGVTIDSNGNLFGTTSTGANGDGTVYEISAKGSYKTLYAFCAKTNCTDGSDPSSSLIVDAKGNLYGVTYSGGTGSGDGGSNDGGVVFKVTPKGVETVLYSFCSQINSSGGCADGQGPIGAPVADGNGNLYGTAIAGGSQCGENGCGVLWELAPNGMESVRYNFCSVYINQVCTDGVEPYAGLVQVGNGKTFYGTTSVGGANNNGGTVFSLTGSTLKTLHAFGGTEDQGANTLQSPVLLLNGELYGTAAQGGVNNGGVLYKITAK